MNKILKAILTITILAALTACGDSSSSPAPTVIQTPDRQLTLVMSAPNFLKSGVYTIALSGIAASSDGVELSVVNPPASGTFGLTVSALNSPVPKLTVLPDATTGAYLANLNYLNVPSGTYRIKAFSNGLAPAFKSYSTSVTFTAK